jgi:hypothetical protein
MLNPTFIPGCVGADFTWWDNYIAPNGSSVGMKFFQFALESIDIGGRKTLGGLACSSSI